MIEVASIAAAVMLYFGAFIIPALYFLRKGVKGSRGLAMLIGAATQLILYGLVFAALALIRSRGGNPEGYASLFYCVGINFLSVAYYVGVFLVGRVAHEKS